LKKQVVIRPPVKKRQTHHITYNPEWTVELTGWQHKVVTHMQRLNPTMENINQATSFLNAVVYEWQRLHFEYAKAKKGNLNP